jgi:hypothetical protein
MVQIFPRCWILSSQAETAPPAKSENLQSCSYCRPKQRLGSRRGELAPSIHRSNRADCNDAKTSVREDVLGLVPGTVWLSRQTGLLKKLTFSKARFRTKFRLADHLAAKRNR